MKLTDFIQGAGRPVAYYPKLRPLTGSTTATILLCQFIYWRGKESNGDGWLYKTSEEIEGETGLSYNEQKTARKHLRDANLLEEHYARLDHNMRFKIDLDAINEKWRMLQPIIPESDNVTFGNDGFQSSLNELETTSEITTDWKKQKQEAQKRKDKQRAAKKDMVDALVEFSRSEGMTASNRYDAIQSQLAVGLGITPLWSRWERFIKHVDHRQRKYGESLETFIAWLRGQKNFDVSYWPPDKMQEQWPRAFAEPVGSGKRHKL